ncbi:TKL family protein kinase [Trichomonas vaginalis G3]|uniref:TKL family protein kinase n=1 Tax=Trichomonas vaginalis (strain ATCC PRA-98 / G3) TaxID=412133 RepID=A2EF13_TRIV3|nr:protein kinase protein [Trichomonas vaginalis G3]EAY08729.1 TKL family protein kinase [Trichomonas vaginalis G3]KAI5507138.1 protein kinase protein [Trichomonas vaginalis G3]|eukprot:XP_001320952.1 TKL family protein kinase [Trichomonas vaginalis G3]
MFKKKGNREKNPPDIQEEHADEEEDNKVVFLSPEEDIDLPKINKSIKRRKSFSYRPILNKITKSKRRNSIDYKPKKFKYISKPEEIGEPKVVKSAETNLYESLHRLVLTFPHLIRDISDFTFQEIIGHGGFGEIWLANDLRTGKIVAIKELFAEKLVGRNLTNFVREIVTMGKCHNRFVIPFIGFTVEKPYCIITEYMPYGSLHNYLRQERKTHKRIFSGTHLTMIAIGLIIAIRYIHVQKIIHRDVKAANVLLDNHYLPKLCDFGISRFFNRKAMTVGIGTASHMAPELMSTSKYDIKADVFAFGCTLYEMVEKKNPFAGYPSKEVIKNHKKGIRPKFYNQEEPDCLLCLIMKCWEQNPNDRPLPIEIFNDFASGRVYFHNTDHNVIKDYVNRLLEELQSISYVKEFQAGEASRWQADTILHIESKLKRSQAVDSMKLAFGIPISEDFEEEEPLMRLDVEEGMHRPSYEEEHAGKAQFIKKTPSTLSRLATLNAILSDSTHTAFKSTIADICGRIKFEDFAPFYGKIIKYFRNKDDEDVAVYILENFTSMINREKRIIKFLDQYHFFSVLPVISEKARRATLFFVAAVFELSPNYIHSTVFRALGSLFKQFPLQTLSLFPHYISRYGRLRNPDPVLDFLLRYARHFVHLDSGELYVQLMYQLTLIDDFSKDRMETIKQTVSAFTRSRNSIVMATALNIFALLYKQGDLVPYDAIIRALPNMACVESCSHLLLRAENYPASKTLFKAISDRSSRPKLARVLIKFVSLSQDHRKIAVLYTKWMTFISPYTFMVFLIIFNDPDLRPIILHSETFSPFISKCLNTIPQETLFSLPTIFKRAQLDQMIINNLTNDEFFQALTTLINENKGNENVLLSIFMTLDKCVQAGYSYQYGLFMETIFKYIQNSSRLTKPAVFLIVNLSSHSPIASQFKAIPGLVAYFETLKKQGVLADAANVFLSNINSVN